VHAFNWACRGLLVTGGILSIFGLISGVSAKALGFIFFVTGIVPFAGGLSGLRSDSDEGEMMFAIFTTLVGLGAFHHIVLLFLLCYEENQVKGAIVKCTSTEACKTDASHRAYVIYMPLLFVGTGIVLMTELFCLYLSYELYAVDPLPEDESLVTPRKMTGEKEVDDVNDTPGDAALSYRGLRYACVSHLMPDGAVEVTSQSDLGEGPFGELHEGCRKAADGIAKRYLESEGHQEDVYSMQRQRVQVHSNDEIKQREGSYHARHPEQFFVVWVKLEGSDDSYDKGVTYEGGLTVSILSACNAHCGMVGSKAVCMVVVYDKNPLTLSHLSQYVYQALHMPAICCKAAQFSIEERNSVLAEQGSQYLLANRLKDATREHFVRHVDRQSRVNQKSFRSDLRGVLGEEEARELEKLERKSMRLEKAKITRAVYNRTLSMRHNLDTDRVTFAVGPEHIVFVIIVLIALIIIKA